MLLSEFHIKILVHKNLLIVPIVRQVLAGEKQRLGRDYDFSEVIKWFAERADLIIVMFDAHKLDISDELKSVLDTLKPHQVKTSQSIDKFSPYLITEINV